MPSEQAIPLEGLDIVLRNDPIIATYHASELRDQPDRVGTVYRTYARTHVSLGDTQKYVETVFRWVGGANQGTFVGAVSGKFGEGKTSFLVHLWEESAARGVLAVPPFEFRGFANALDGITGWMRHMLRSAHPAEARAMDHVYDQFRLKTLGQTASQVAAKTSVDPDVVLRILQQVGVQEEDVDVSSFLNCCAQLAEVAQRAGYRGLLILLDEPEELGRTIGWDRLAFLLRDLANELGQRQGHYGVFLSIPEDTLAVLESMHSATVARLQVRRCFIRLGELYGSEFARDLWHRYTEAAGLPACSDPLVTPEGLTAIGQLGSSRRTDLGYGPRTVVSAFRRIAGRYAEGVPPYGPADFARDCLDQEVLVSPGYRDRVREALSHPEVSDKSRDAILYLAAFPDGLSHEDARAAGLYNELAGLSRSNRIVYRASALFGLHALLKDGDRPDPLRETLLAVIGQYSPSLAAFGKARRVFATHLLGSVFEERKAPALYGWKEIVPWQEVNGHNALVAILSGAFQQTQTQFPGRSVAVAVSDASHKGRVHLPELPQSSSTLQLDAVIHFRLLWRGEDGAGSRMTVCAGDPGRREPAQVEIVVDLNAGVVRQDRLAEMYGAEHMSPFFALYLVGEMEAFSLPAEAGATWQAIRTQVMRELVGLALPDALCGPAGEQLGSAVHSAGQGLLGSVLQTLFNQRYPEYVTLMRVGHWRDRVGSYQSALQSNLVPSSAKKGQRKWLAQGEDAPRAFGISRMNLPNAFEGLESLVTISSSTRSGPVEVGFHIHPFEARIVEFIDAGQGDGSCQVNVEGQDCRAVPARALVATFESSGYTREELSEILAIGVARGSFAKVEHDGDNLLARVPVDLEDRRRQLIAQVDEVEADLIQLRRVPRFRDEFDAGAFRQAVHKLDDEAEYERLASLLRKAAETRSQLPGHFEQVAVRLGQVRSHVKTYLEQFNNASEIGVLRRAPTGHSRWVEDLTSCVHANLGHLVAELRSGATSVTEDARASANRFAYASNLTVAQNVALLLDGLEAVEAAETAGSEFSRRVSELLGQMRDYESWVRLLRRSDELLDAINKLQTEGGDSSFASGLRDDYDRVADSISDHLRVRNVSGLAQHGQFRENLDEIDRARHRHIIEQKGHFELAKNAVNAFLDGLQVGNRADIEFNPSEAEQSYAKLYEQGVAHVLLGVVDQPLAEAATQARELSYAVDILATSRAEEVRQSLGTLEDAGSRLAELRSSLDVEWLKRCVSEGTSGADELVEASGALNNFVRSARRLAVEVAKPNPPEAGRALRAYELIPDQEGIDLKSLMLQYMPDGKTGEGVLEESLDAIGDLFRRNCIQIRVERRRG